MARRGAVARARDIDISETLERRPARLPVAERKERVDGAARAILLDRLRIGGGRALCFGQELRMPRDRRLSEEREVRLLRRPRERAREAADEDHSPVLPDRGFVPPETERVAECDLRSGE